MSDDIRRGIQKMYDEIGSHFSRTRQKKYGGGSANWVVTDQYLAKLVAGQSVLDLGCGNGKLLTGLPKGVTYLGTDFSETLLDEARKLHPEQKFVMGDVVTEDHWKNLEQYEAIFCVAVLHHIPTRAEQVFVLKKIKEHLKKNGFAYITVWNLWQERFLQYHLETHVEVPYNKKWKRYCVAYDVQMLTDIATEAGLDVTEIFYADKEGKKTDIVTGENLILICK